MLPQASGEGQLPYMMKYEVFPQIYPSKKRGCLIFESLHSVTFYGALVQLLYFEKPSSGWRMLVRLKQTSVVLDTSEGYL